MPKNNKIKKLKRKNDENAETRNEVKKTQDKTEKSSWYDPQTQNW